MEHTLPWWRWLMLILLIGSMVGVWLYLNRNRLHPKHWLDPQESKIEILEKKWIGPKSTLSLVRVENQSFLLALTPTSASWQKLDPLESITPLRVSSKIDPSPSSSHSTSKKS